MISIDHAPRNAKSRVVSVGLVPAIEELNRQTGHAEAVLLGVGSSLMADADIREFGQRELSEARRRRAAGFNSSPMTTKWRRGRSLGIANRRGASGSRL